jgi:hypothetical protein
VAERDGRFIRSAINVPVMRDLIVFLTMDCCGGRPDLCGVAAGVHGSPADGEQSCCSPITATKVQR